MLLSEVHWLYRTFSWPCVKTQKNKAFAGTYNVVPGVNLLGCIFFFTYVEDYIASPGNANRDTIPRCVYLSVLDSVCEDSAYTLAQRCVCMCVFVCVCVYERLRVVCSFVWMIKRRVKHKFCIASSPSPSPRPAAGLVKRSVYFLTAPQISCETGSWSGSRRRSRLSSVLESH